ncbi:MAG: hypothetical protein JO340_20975 [Acidobacteriaceae bacterium]|nr:hypothetical protein [Acidobacteriaceae bacterium]
MVQPPRLTSRYRVIIGGTALLGLIIWIDLHYFNRFLFARPYQGIGTVLPGETIRAISGVDVIDGHRVSLPSNHLNFLLYFNNATPQNVQKVLYASYLIRKYHAPDVTFAIVTGGHFQDLEELRRNGDIRLPIINDDTFVIAHTLTVPRSQDSLFIFDRRGSVLFASPEGAFESEDLREFYERYELGRIEYRNVASESFIAAPGAPFPDLAVREIWSRREGPLSSFTERGKTQYIVFTARCPACALRNLLVQIADNKRGGAVPVFSSSFPEPVIREYATQLHIAHPLYLAKSELTGFEDLYFQNVSSAEQGLLVATNAKGLITSITHMHGPKNATEPGQP